VTAETSIARVTARHAATLWLPVVLWAGLIFALSSVPSLDTGLSWDYPLRKLAHAGEFAVLGALLARAVPELAALWLGIAYAVVDELHQTFVPGRAGTLLDVGIDSVGVLLGILALRRLGR
jgi:VanZ family protein